MPSKLAGPNSIFIKILRLLKEDIIYPNVFQSFLVSHLHLEYFLTSLRLQKLSQSIKRTQN